MKNLLASTALIALLTTGLVGMAHADTVTPSGAPAAVTAPAAPVVAPTVSGIDGKSGQVLDQKKSVENNIGDKTKGEIKPITTPSTAEPVKSDKLPGKTSMNTHHSRIKATQVKATVPATGSVTK